MKIGIREFEGTAPRVSKRLLGLAQAQTAQNCDVLGGGLRTISEPKLEENIVSGQISLYRQDDAAFLTFPTDVDVVRSPLSLDTFNRIYFTGDGKPKVRVNFTTNFDLGIPKPVSVPIATAQAKTTTTFTRTWKGFYEELDGTQVDNKVLVEGTDIIETEVGKVYTIAIIASTIPKVAASAEAVLVLTFVAKDTGGNELGTLFPDHSRYTDNTDFVLDGAAVSGAQVNATDAVLTLRYDTSSSSDFIVARSYVYTFVSALGEEGPPSDASTVISVSPVEDANVTAIDTTPPTGNFNITDKRIYRTVTAATGVTEFQFVKEITLATSSFLDTITDGATGEVLKSTDWIPPPADLKGLIAMPGGFLAGFKDKDVYYSDVNQPHAWPLKFVRTVPYDIVGLGVAGNSTVVLTKGFPELITGIDPRNMAQSRIHLNQACVSKRSIADKGTGIMYVSLDGIILVQDGVAALVSEPWFKREQWKDLNPETMIGEIHDQRYHLFNSTVQLIFDFDEGKSAITNTDETADGLYSDLEEDRLYLIQGTKIVSWDNTEISKTIKWLSREFNMTRGVYPALGRVIADGYPVTLKVIGDSAVRATIAVTDSAAFRLPPVERAKYWSMEIESGFNVDEILIGSTMADLK